MPLCLIFHVHDLFCVALLATYERAKSKLDLACETSDLATDASDIERVKSRQRR